MLRALCLVVCLLPTLASAEPWLLLPGTRVVADVAWRGQGVEVRFPTIAGSIDFDADRPETARAMIRVAAVDATTGLPPVDALLRGPDYLDAARHPTIDFRLDRLEQTSGSTADIFGSITFRGVTRPIRFEAMVIRYGAAADDPRRFEAGFDLTGQLDRREFGSVAGQPDIAVVLPIRIRLLMASR